LKVWTCVQPTPTPCPGVNHLYFDDFSDPNTLSNYGFIYENWGSNPDFAVTQGVFLDAPVTHTQDVAVAQSSLVSTNLSDYTVESDLESDAQNTILGVAFRVLGTSYYSFQWNGYNSRWEVEKNTGLISYSYPAYSYSYPAYSAGTTIHLKVVSQGDTFNCYADKNDGNGVTLLFSNVVDTSFPTGGAGMRPYQTQDHVNWRADNFNVNGCPGFVTSPTPTGTLNPTNTFTPTLTFTNTPTPTATPLVTSYTYDDNGNLIKEITTGAGTPTTITYEYNYENRLSRMVNAVGLPTTYVYNYAGELMKVKPISGGTTYTYGKDGELFMDGSSKYLWRANGRIIEEVGGNGFFYSDGIGNVVTDFSNGIHPSIRKMFTYDPFGKIIATTGSGPNPYEFIGAYGVRDATPDSGNRYIMGVRTYDSSLGRFLSEDPIGFKAESNFYRYVESVGKPSLNPYDYSRNNPLRWTDPLGLFAVGISGEISTINPFTSGGGFVAGYNLEYTSDSGWHIYSFSTPPDVGSTGFNIGRAG